MLELGLSFERAINYTASLKRLHTEAKKSTGVRETGESDLDCLVVVVRAVRNGFMLTEGLLLLRSRLLCFDFSLR